MSYVVIFFFFFFFNDTATTEIYTLSLYDALPIWLHPDPAVPERWPKVLRCRFRPRPWRADRKSTRLNSSHRTISYAVFCLKKKKSIEIVVTVLKKKQTN